MGTEACQQAACFLGQLHVSSPLHLQGLSRRHGRTSVKESSALRGGRRGSGSFLRDCGVCRALILGLARSGLSMPAQQRAHHALSSSADSSPHAVLCVRAQAQHCALTGEAGCVKLSP